MARFDDDKSYWRPNADEEERKGAAYSIKSTRGGGGEPVAPQSPHNTKPIQSVHGRRAQWGASDTNLGGRIESMAKVKTDAIRQGSPPRWEQW